MNANTERILIWLKAIAAAFIGGGATAASSWAGLVVAQNSGADVAAPNLKGLGIIFLSAGLINVLLYLKQSPLPGEERPAQPPR